MLRWLMLPLFISTIVFAQQESARMANRRALVQAEQDFAKAVATNGIRSGFLEFLAPDGIVFQPGPVNGKQFWTARPARKGLLSWEPVFADVSQAGDLGYTTGPWEFRPNGPNDKPVAFGQYFTIWKRQSDGSWKAALDRGVGSEQPFAGNELEFPREENEGKRDTKFDIASGRAELMKLETETSRASETKGLITALGAFIANDARVLRENVAPAVGRKAALALLSEKRGKLSWKPAAVDISQSGDLGYAYGAFDFIDENGKTEHGSYVRVWKKQKGKWKIMIDVASPDPA